MTGKEIEFVKEQLQFSITGASDWPMAIILLTFAGVVIVGSYGTVCALIVYIWRDLKNRLAEQRQEELLKHESCKTEIWNHIRGPVWTAIDSYCKDMPDIEKLKIKDEIQRQIERVY